jgi:hypothetical protein
MINVMISEEVAQELRDKLEEDLRVADRTIEHWVHSYEEAVRKADHWRTMYEQLAHEHRITEDL